uniref:RING-type domain-containing protein n=1 Tax=Parastrongyloides trichosuri TaxID=131310 RepID=A0A0N4Z2H4_PARTI
MASSSFFQEEATCCVCMNILESPKTLPCGHTLCSQCLQSLYETTHRIITNEDFLPAYSCPTCRLSINLEPNQIAVNVILQKIISTYQNNVIERSPVKKSEIFCITCNKVIPDTSTYVCKTCDNELDLKYYCAICGWKNHSSHNFIKYDQNEMIKNKIVQLNYLKEFIPINGLNEELHTINVKNTTYLTDTFNSYLTEMKNLETIVREKALITTDVANEIGGILNASNELLEENKERIKNLKIVLSKGSDSSKDVITNLNDIIKLKSQLLGNIDQFEGNNEIKNNNINKKRKL